MFNWLKKKSIEKKETFDFEAIVNEYGKVLDETSHQYTSLYPIECLPYPKSTIKRAIADFLKATKNPDTIEALKIGYISLADFQEGVTQDNFGNQTLDILKDGISSPNNAKKFLQMKEKQKLFEDRASEELKTIEKELEMI